MGGIKNLEAKKKANHVVSSGAGGGTRGPALLDKRGQETKCPFCDKVYQQSGRLKEHIATKHKDQVQEDTAPSGSQSSTARPESAKPAAASSSKQAPVLQSGASSSKPSSSGRPSSAAGPGASTSGGPAPVTGGVMDIGSPAGYYTYKSPRLHLHEWCSKDRNRTKPRYILQLKADGISTYKVVLPHTRKKEEDIVVFLDPRFTDGAQGNDLEQRAAVAALHHVAGDRNFQALLPPDYRPLWQALDQARAERKEAAARRNESQGRRQQYQKERQARDRARKPPPLILSRQMQQLVKALILQDLQQRAQRQARPSRTSNTLQAEVSPRLMAMEFSAAQVQSALDAVAPGPATSAADYEEELLDWLLVSIPTEQLPARFTANAHMTNAVSKVDTSKPPPPPVPAAVQAKQPHGSIAAQQGRVLSELEQYGYDQAVCEAALITHEGKVLRALAQLFADLTSTECRPGCVGPAGDESEWQEEVMVLEAIYGDDCVVEAGCAAVHITCDLPDVCAVALTGVTSPKITLHAWCGSDGGGDAYPSGLPILAVSCEALAPHHLRHLTRALTAHAQSLTGQPMLHELVAHLVEAAEKLTEADGLLDESAPPADLAGGVEEQQEEEESDGADVDVSDGDDDEDVTDITSSTCDVDTDAPEMEARARDEAAGGELESAASGLVEQFEGLGMCELGGVEEDDAGSTSSASETASQQSVATSQVTSAGPRSGPRSRPKINVEAESRRLQEAQRVLQTSAAHADMQATRAKLPAAAARQQVLAELGQHAVLVISGATGCGKSTQVPQFILEEAISRGQGGAVNIIVTQPRRISALGLAQRVAQERGEEVGNSVGYSVRMDSRTSARTRLLFCTTGILLRRLLSDPLLSDISHVVLDEVHERSIEIDLLLLLLRDVLVQRASIKSSHPGSPPPPPLQVVLMSATADAQLFADYMQLRLSGAKGPLLPGVQPSFMSVGQLTIPGFTYPVRELYLEDILESTRYVVGRTSKYAKKGAAAKAGLADAQLGTSLSQAQGYSESTARSLALVNEELINYELLAALVTHVVQEQQEHGPAACMQGWQEGLQSLKQLGKTSSSSARAILVFLPGAPEISRAARALKEHGPLIEAAGGLHKLRIMPLHGSLSARDQSAVFARPPPGHYKIVLSTNVAETSVTIDDVLFVIDTGRAKEMQHDTERGILRLQEQWVSQAAAQQRRGRAGRVRPGVCFRLFSREQWARTPSHTQPEMLRSPLESVCLLIKGMLSSKPVGQVLAQCLTPPAPAAVQGAVQLLQNIGAFDQQEFLTALGQHLQQMPMDPRVGKMLVYGALLGCLDPVLTIAAAMAHGRPVFLSSPPEQQADVSKARGVELGEAASAASDHIALIAMFNKWAASLSGTGGRADAARLCSSCALSESSLEAVAAGRVEYAGVLADLGFLPRSSVQLLGGRGSGGNANKQAWMALPINSHSDKSRFIKAAVMAGFYPNVLRVQHPPTKYVKMEGAGTMVAEPSAREVKFWDKDRGRAFIHPGSINFNVGHFTSGWLVYTQMTATTKLYVRESSMAPIYSLLLFGGQLTVDYDNALVEVGDQAAFFAAPCVGVLIKSLRTSLNAVLARKISDPGYEMSTDPTVSAVMELLKMDGY